MLCPFFYNSILCSCNIHVSPISKQWKGNGDWKKKSVDILSLSMLAVKRKVQSASKWWWRWGNNESLLSTTKSPYFSWHQYRGTKSHNWDIITRVWRVVFFYWDQVRKWQKLHIAGREVIDFWRPKITYDSFSDVEESRVWFASKNLTPCRMHWHAFTVDKQWLWGRFDRVLPARSWEMPVKRELPAKIRILEKLGRPKFSF